MTDSLHLPADQSELVTAQFIRQLPKAELHVHIEGTLEPDLLFDLAARNQIAVNYDSVDALRQAYQFDSLQSFLDLYYAGTKVLRTERDFFEMTWAYLERAHVDGIVHTEIMFDPQAHTERGVLLQTVFSGIARALRQGQRELGISAYMIMCFLRHLSEDDAIATLDEALRLRHLYSDLWIGIGLDSSEHGHPPEKFEHVFARCRELGFRLVAHAGEEGPAEYVRSALDVLQIERIDHGVRSEEDPELMQRIIDMQIPLTVCPLSNLKLGVVNDLTEHNVVRLLRRGALVTLNSDDPSYFGGYLVDNYVACAEKLGLSRTEIKALAQNSIKASFLPIDAKQIILNLPAYTIT